MNRELKFRIWSKRDKNFLHNIEQNFDLVYSEEKWYILGGNELDENYVIQQFTELYDKNKKPIYEGDRVKFSYTGDHVFYGEVIWLRYSASFGVRTVNASETFAFDDLMDPLGLHEDTMDYVKYLEVVGNIFEHPELLKNE